jgi:hypothetical protein
MLSLAHDQDVAVPRNMCARIDAICNLFKTHDVFSRVTLGSASGNRVSISKAVAMMFGSTEAKKVLVRAVLEVKICWSSVGGVVDVECLLSW